MSEVGFYHLLTTPLERALPRLLERARAQGLRIVVRAASTERVEHLNALLWTYDDAGFLPHGSARDGNPAEQPIWLSDCQENPNGATILVLGDEVEADGIAAIGVLPEQERYARRRRLMGRRHVVEAGDLADPIARHPALPGVHHRGRRFRRVAGEAPVAERVAPDDRGEHLPDGFDLGGAGGD